MSTDPAFGRRLALLRVQFLRELRYGCNDCLPTGDFWACEKHRRVLTACTLRPRECAEFQEWLKASGADLEKR